MVLKDGSDAGSLEQEFTDGVLACHLGESLGNHLGLHGRWHYDAAILIGHNEVAVSDSYTTDWYVASN